MNYCRKCGKILDNDEKECPFCGTKVDEIVELEPGAITEEKDNIKEDAIKEDINEENNYIENYNYTEIPKLDKNNIEDNNVEKNTGEKINIEKNNINNNIYEDTKPLSNWIKVTLSVLIPALPGLGALIGIIASIIFMTNEDEDRKTFGYALLTYSVIFLILLCACCMIFSLLAPMGMFE